MPVGSGATVLAVLDPAVENPATSADEALALARATGNVGASPRIQLVRLAFDDPESAFGPEWTGWIILSTDVPGHWSGGPYLGPSAPPVATPYATFTWVYVALDGEVMPNISQDRYMTPESVPSLP